MDQGKHFINSFVWNDHYRSRMAYSIKLFWILRGTFFSYIFDWLKCNLINRNLVHVYRYQLTASAIQETYSGKRYTSVLKLKSVESVDSDVYTCTAYNGYGQKSINVSLTVTGTLDYQSLVVKQSKLKWGSLPLGPRDPPEKLLKIWSTKHNFQQLSKQWTYFGWDPWILYALHYQSLGQVPPRPLDPGLR